MEDTRGTPLIFIIVFDFLGLALSRAPHSVAVQASTCGTTVHGTCHVGL